MPPSAPRQTQRLEFSLCLLVLAAVLSFLLIDSLARSRHIAAVSASPGFVVSTPPPGKHAAASPDLPLRHSLILPARSMDGYHWLIQTQAMSTSGGIRIRHVDYDGAPAGREVHWAAPYRAWIAFLSSVSHERDEPQEIAIARSAFTAGPILLGLALIVFTPLLALRFAPAAGALFAAGCVAVFPFYIDFVSGYVDHHGIANLCALASVLLLFNAHDDIKRRRRAMIASAIAGGLGLWISAATQIPVLIGLGLGMATACCTERGEKPTARWLSQPYLFRLWGITGATVSVIAYLVEYFPSHLGMRFEVNHPLHALAWLAGGEALCRLAKLWSRPPTQSARRDLTALIAALALATILPLTVLVSKEHTFLVADSFLWRLHRDFIAEFQSLPVFLKRSGYAASSLAWCAPFLFLAPALWLTFSKKIPASTRASLQLALVPGILILLLAWSQVRWWSLAFALLVPVIAVFFRTLKTSSGNARRASALWALACGLLLVPGLLSTAKESTRASDWTDTDIQTIAERDVARWLRQRAGDEKVVVAASPTTTTSLVFHGGLTGIGTLYWENLTGLKTAAALYAAPTADAARQIATHCGLTHIVVISWDGFEGVYTRLSRDLASDAPLPTDTFIASLLSAPVPPSWLRPLHFNLPPAQTFAGQQIRIYEIITPQSETRALINAAEYFLDSSRPDVAARLATSLEVHRAELPAQIMLAYLAARANDAPAFSRALGALPSNAGRDASLTLDDEIRLIAVLAAAERFEPAAAVLESSLRKTTPRDLRRLSTAKLIELVSFAEASGLRWPDPSLQSTARALLPPPASGELRN
jgi:hypothetical protein